ncbi:hypothetical protein [Marinicauda sp. Alg238-R41]|uniref:Cap15 family cyclic dinucleotide receptor domain-containing protein n=1 Tax=Marinicauda sp. Alg238-R41 TaxID=2993447 RepID=UPI0022DF6D42|nr:hypothetical protein [Marinicauda sp. Alg238-R41]
MIAPLNAQNAKILFGLFFFLTFAILALWVFLGPSDPSKPFAWLRAAPKTFTVATIVFGFSVGTSFYLSPWRVLSRGFPVLRKTLLPDLNGIWEGEISSNYSRIEAAHQGKAADGVALKVVPIRLRIKHSLLAFSMSGKTPDTDGDTVSSIAGLYKNAAGEWSIDYIYDQTVASPKQTDENWHKGAASLKLSEDGSRLEGVFWTRRQWHLAKNTAGTVKLNRSNEFR